MSDSHIGYFIFINHMQLGSLLSKFECRKFFAENVCSRFCVHGKIFIFSESCLSYNLGADKNHITIDLECFRTFFCLGSIISQAEWS